MATSDFPLSSTGDNCTKAPFSMCITSMTRSIFTSCFYCVFMCKGTHALKEGMKSTNPGRGWKCCKAKCVVVSFWWLHCTYSDTRHHLHIWWCFKSALPIFSPPWRLALCGSMCLGKTAFCTNWSQWQKLQGCMSRLHLHGNTPQ